MGDETILEQVQADVRTAMKAGERERAAALRLIVDALQQDAKLGKGDEIAVLQRERKKRLEAADAFAQGGRSEQAAAESAEAKMIEAYLPEQLSDEELGEIAQRAIEEAGRERAARDGQGDGAGHAGGRRPRRRQAGQPGGAGTSWLVGS